jgi:GAF domain-containing protein
MMSDTLNGGLDRGREALRRFLAGEDDMMAMLTKIVLIATETVPGCDLASITMLRNGEPMSPVFSEKAAGALDETQYATGDGPCLAAIRERGVIELLPHTDQRWPSFNEAALAMGVWASLSAPLGNEEAVVGALNLHSRTADGFDRDARRVAELFADQIGVAAAKATVFAEGYELAQQLARAMESRAVIEQAKGILMEVQDCTAEEAFAILARASQHQNRKLRAIAAEIVERRGR